MDRRKIKKMEDVPYGMIFTPAGCAQYENAPFASRTDDVAERLAEIVRILLGIVDDGDSKSFKLCNVIAGQRIPVPNYSIRDAP